MLDYALRAMMAGLSVMPARQDGTKQPLGISNTNRSWKAFQSTRANEHQIRAWYEDSDITNIGFITGKVSGNLEVIDFDDVSAYHSFKGAAAESGLKDIVEKIESGYLEHSPRGVHWFYRCETIEGNKKLASRLKEQAEMKDEKDKVQVMIETRGEGGYIIAAPSHGAVNAKGEYTLIRGSLENIATITKQERDELHHLAMAFDAMPKHIEKAEIYQSFDSLAERPGDAFNESASWDEILTPHGWKRCFSKGDETFWTRPGKQFGISATTNYQGSGLFYCFSSSTEFEQNRGFSKFAVYTYLNHGGDFSTSATNLALDGHGSNAPVESFNFKVKEKKSDALDMKVIPPFLMDVPGIVNDVRDWLVATAIRPQPILAFAASLALAGLLMSRRVATTTGLRTNLLIIGLGDSACGKDANRQGVKRILYETDNGGLIGSENIGSESGLIDELIKLGGRAIYQLDEIGHMLTAMTNKRSQGYLAAVIPTMMKLQSSAGHKWIGKTLAKDKKTGIHERADLDDPCIVVYGTSVPGKFYQAIDYNNIEDGFLPRFLVFESDDPFPLTNYDRKSPEVPDHIIEHVKQWEDEFQAGYFDKILSEPRKVRHTDETLLIMREFEKKVQKEYKQERLNKCHPVWGRAQAMAEQLALLFTCSGNPATNRICPVSARKACALAAVLCTQQVARIKGNVSSNEYEADVLKIMKSISESAHEGISKRDLVRKHQSIQSKRLLDILSMLQQSEKVVCCKKATIRKPKMMYYSSEYVEIEEE